MPKHLAVALALAGWLGATPGGASSGEMAPLPDPALRELAEQLWEEGRYEEAAALLGRLREPEEWDLFDLEQLAEVLVEQGPRGSATAAYRELVNGRWSALDRMRRWREQLLEEGRRDDALRVVEREVEAWLGLARAWEGLAHCLVREERHGEAQAAYHQRILLQAEPPAPLAELEARLGGDRRYAERLAEHARRLERLPNAGLAHYGLATLHATRAEDEAAAESFRKAIEAVGDGGPLRSRLGRYLIEVDKAALESGLGWALLRLGRAEEAADAFRRAVTLEPDSPWRHRALGIALFELERFSEAAAALRKAVEIRPEADAAFWLAWTLRKLGEEDQALAYARQAIDLGPEDPRPHRLMALVLSDRGELPEAVAALQKAIDLAPDFAPTRGLLGWTLLRDGQVGGALAEFVRAADQALQDAVRRAFAGSR